MAPDRHRYQRVADRESRHSEDENYEFYTEYYSGDRTRSCRRMIYRMRSTIFLTLIFFFALYYFMNNSQNMIVYKTVHEEVKLPVPLPVTKSPRLTTPESTRKRTKALGGELKCDEDLMKPSKVNPTDVNKIRPADIRVIATLGDSISEGWGPRNFEDDKYQHFYGLSLFSGGDESVETHITVTNILKKFNPKLIGISEGTTVMGFNVAKSGRTSEDLERQTNLLVEMISKNRNVSITEDWKLVTLFMGTNDILDLGCRGKGTPVLYDKYKGYVENSLRFLQKKLPRTIVAVMGMWNAQFAIDARSIITKGKRFTCSDKPEEQIKQRDDAISSYQRALGEIQNNTEFHTANFTVVVEGFMNNIHDAFTNKSGTYDASFYHSDLFHLSKYGNAVLAKWFWNGLMRPAGEETTPSLNDDKAPLLCPDQTVPFIRTLGNS